ncbi:hypothetical protein E1176_17260, partial [Fulvivirga sp. RKSG066]|uniref:hypothetical protein n=1 Tax=Fulvivirga aurantia TaxID=2529383 RepID=UPI0012BB7E54
MENNSHLKYLINEEIFVLNEPDLSVPQQEKSTPKKEEQEIAPAEVKPQPQPLSFIGNASSPVLILF